MSNTNYQQIARNTGFLYFRMFIVMAVTLYTSRVIIHALGFEDFGIYNVVGSVVTFLSFFQAALRNATFRFLTYELGVGDDVRLKRVYSMAINSHLILSVILLLVMEIGGVWFINNKLVIAENRLLAANWVYQFSLLTFCVGIIRTPYESNVIAHERMDFYALTGIIEVLFKLIIVYLLIVIPEDKLITYGILLFLVSLILGIWNVIYCKIKFKDCVYLKCWDKKILLSFTSYSGWSILVNGATITRTQCINIFFNQFLGVLANAAMGVANQVIAALNMFVSNFTQAFKPQIIKSWAAKEYDNFMKLVFSTSKICYFMLLWIVIPVVINIDFLLKLWLGEYPPMTPVLVYTWLIYYLIDALQEPLVVSVHATGNLKFHQIMIATIVFFVIPVSYIMLRLGFSGGAVMLINAFANLLCAIGRTLYMQKLIKLNLQEYLRNVILPVMVVTIVSVPLPVYTSRLIETTWFSVVLLTLGSMMLTAVSCYFFGLNRTERELIKTMPIVNKLLRKYSNDA